MTNATILNISKMKRNELIAEIATMEIGFTGKGHLVPELKGMLTYLIEGQQKEVEVEVEVEVPVVRKRTPQAPLSESEALAVLGRRIKGSSKKDYAVDMGAFEVTVPRKPTGDVFKDLKVAYMFTACDESLMDGDVDFQSDLEIEAYDLVKFVNTYRPSEIGKMAIWINEIESCATESVANYEGEEEDEEEVEGEE